MKPTGIIDLHCDTLTARHGERQKGAKSLTDPGLAFSFARVPAGIRWAQCCAIYIPDALRGRAAADYFDYYADSFDRQMAYDRELVVPCASAAGISAAFDGGRHAAILTVEGGAALCGDLGRVEYLKRRGVRMLTLVWNGENELGSGNSTQKGLTAFGKAAVRRLEEAGIIVDCSHLNDRGFEDLCAVSARPFIASHSNARAVCAQPRNLLDGQICEIALRGGLIGLNFYRRFLRRDGEAGLDDLYRHLSHFLALGAEKAVAIGSDFDGAEIPAGFDRVEKIPAIWDYLARRGLSQPLLEDLFFRNAFRYFVRMLP